MKKGVKFGIAVVSIIVALLLAMTAFVAVPILVIFDPLAGSVKEAVTDLLGKEKTGEWEFEEGKIEDEYWWEWFDIDHYEIVYYDEELFGDKFVFVGAGYDVMDMLEAEGYEKVAGSGKKWKLKYNSRAWPEKYWIEEAGIE